VTHVSIEQLAKSFAGKPPTRVIDGLDLQVEEGEFLVLLGPSGCGKTTTLRCLAGLEAPTAGRSSLDGRIVFDDARRLNLSPDKRSIGMVFQSYDERHGSRAVRLLDEWRIPDGRDDCTGDDRRHWDRCRGCDGGRWP
jgi:ABC-type sulfate/molybdate transport systems ATPase subunit